MNIINLEGHIPNHVYAHLPVAINRFEINTAFRMAHMLGQIKQETLFTGIRENLNYSENGLLRVFPAHFTTDPAITKKRLASQYAHKPEAIANYVYAGKYGNGAEVSGDGWKFRGAPYLGITFRAEYQKFADAMGDLEIMTNTDKVLTDYPLISAAWIFKSENFFQFTDKGITDDAITRLSHRINELALGLPGRIKFTKEFYNLLIK